MINPSLIESSTFFFSIKATHLFYKVFLSSDQRKDSKYTNDVDVNNALSCLMPTTLRPKNITAVVAAMVAMSGPSPIGFLAAAAPTVDPSLIDFLMFF